MPTNHGDTSGMRCEEFDELNRLCLAHSHIFDYRQSPKPDELDAFDPLLRQTPYVAGMFRTKEFRAVIDALENGFQARLREFNRSLETLPPVQGLPLQPVLDNVDNPADDPPVVNARHTVRERKEWRYPSHLALAQQKQIRHGEEPSIMSRITPSRIEARN